VSVEVAGLRPTQLVGGAQGVTGEDHPCLKRRSKSINRDRCYVTNFGRHSCPRFATRHRRVFDFLKGIKAGISVEYVTFLKRGISATRGTSASRILIDPIAI